MREALIAIVAAALVPAFFWIGGFDFDSRGFLAAMCAAYTIFVGFSAWLIASL